MLLVHVPGRSTTDVVDDAGVEKYSPDDLDMKLNGKCHPNLVDYLGIWIEKDPRPARAREGCAYAFYEDDCAGSYNPIELAFSG